jgi:hypothetical protein
MPYPHPKATHMTHKRVRVLSTILLLMLAPVNSASVRAEDGLGFAHSVCDIFEAPIEHATFTGGAGCTWLIGDGDVGTTRTEILMTADRNIDNEKIVMLTAVSDDLFAKTAEVPGYRKKAFVLNCEGDSAPAKMVLWGMPSKSNVMGYAVCGNNFLGGSIHTPPGSDMETEVVFEKLMKAMLPLLKK